MHDAELYPNPFDFNPERFISPDPKTPSRPPQPDPRIYAYGFGRRTCPGQNFAEMTMLLTVAGIMSRFNIGLPIGQPPPKIEFTPGITRSLFYHYLSFQIVLTLCQLATSDLLRSVLRPAQLVHNSLKSPPVVYVVLRMLKYFLCICSPRRNP